MKHFLRRIAGRCDARLVFKNAQDGERKKKERNTIRNITRMTKLVATINYQMAAKSPGHDERNIIKGVRGKKLRRQKADPDRKNDGCLPLSRQHWNQDAQKRETTKQTNVSSSE